MSGYAFILTPIEVATPCDIEVAPGHRISKADRNQVAAIKFRIERIRAIQPVYASHYENNSRRVPGDDGGYSVIFDPLPEDKWRYWVVSFEGTSSELPNLQEACSLITRDIELGFHFFSHGDTVAFAAHPDSLHAFFQEAGLDMAPKQIGPTDFTEIRSNFDAIKNFSPQYSHVLRALRRFDQLRSLPRRSELVTIGLFSIIESLVAHAPKMTDNADSLCHQIRTKIPMLRKRFKTPLDYDGFGSGPSEETLWNKLYAYRSKIVHGEDSAIDGDIQILRDQQTVIQFLREAAKRLLRFSLGEPEFMTDLKKC